MRARGVAAQATAATLRAQLEQHTKATATLRANIQALEGKVAAALSKKETLKARAMSAQVTHPLLPPAPPPTLTLSAHLLLLQPNPE